MNRQLEEKLSLYRHFVSGSIRATLHHGQNRFQKASELLNHDVVLTTYDTVRSEWSSKKMSGISEKAPLYSIEWQRIVLDEGLF